MWFYRFTSGTFFLIPVRFLVSVLGNSAKIGFGCRRGHGKKTNENYLPSRVDVRSAAAAGTTCCASGWQAIGHVSSYGCNNDSRHSIRVRDKAATPSQGSRPTISFLQYTPLHYVSRCGSSVNIARYAHECAYTAELVRSSHRSPTCGVFDKYFLGRPWRRPHTEIIAVTCKRNSMLIFDFRSWAKRTRHSDTLCKIHVYTANRCAGLERVARTVFPATWGKSWFRTGFLDFNKTYN